MNQSKIKEFLANNQGYLKWGNKKLAKKFNVSASSMEFIRLALKVDESKEVFVAELDRVTKPIKWRTTPGVYFLMPCVHSPFENTEFVNAAVNYVSSEIKNLKGLVIMGDFIDMASLSSHDTGKVAIKGITLDYEYEETNRVLDYILAKLPKDITKDYIFGNHEDRYFRAMKHVDTSKLGSALISPTKGLKLIERGFNVLEDWKNDSIRLGNSIEVCHGEFCNVHTAKKHIDTYRTSLCYAHTHRVQTYIEGQVGGWNIGSMADFNTSAFGYATKAMKTSWNNGFALCTIDELGFYHMQPIIWVNNRFYVNGVCYK